MISIIITGPPGIGKTTIFMKVIDDLKKRSIKISGIVCPDVRGDRGRIGFKIIDLSTGSWRWLAKLKKLADGECRVEFGRYCIDVDGVKEIVNESMKHVEGSDIICIDEVGPMEFKSRDFKIYLDKVFNSGKPLLLIVHRNIVDSIAYQLKSLGRDVKVYRVDHLNRNHLHKKILKDLNIIQSKDQ